MNHRLSGKRLLARRSAGVLLSLLLVALLACDKRIQGEPEKVVEEYLQAVKADDFETIYKINRVTARQMRYLKEAETGDVGKMLQERFEEHKSLYFSTSRDVFSDSLWKERYFFPPSASFKVKKAKHLEMVGDDPVNAEYEKGFLVIVPVEVVYSQKKSAPKQHGRKIKEAVYDCNLGKIRKVGTVRIYSHDETWFFAQCIFDSSSVVAFFD